MAASRTIVNCTTGEVTQVDLTDDELAHFKTQQEAQEAADAERKAADEKRAADKASGDAKLKELGFTDDEIAAR